MSRNKETVKKGVSKRQSQLYSQDERRRKTAHSMISRNVWSPIHAHADCGEKKRTNVFFFHSYTHLWNAAKARERKRRVICLHTKKEDSAKPPIL